MRLQAFRAIASAAVLVLTTLVVPAAAQFRAEPYVSGLSSPLGFVQDPADPNVQYIVEQAGRIKIVNAGVLQSTPFLDLTAFSPAIVSCCSERGLLGLAFPSNYGSSGFFFVFFTATAAGAGTPSAGNVVVARFSRSAANRFVAEPSSRFDLRWSTGSRYIEHTSASNHNGGALAFGPDSMLYIAVGDGGGSGDPEGDAQNTSNFLGKILRVDATSDGALLSSDGLLVPSTNPGFPRPEIWSIGWRNPWRMTFDRGVGGTGAMLIGDVGQGAREEIDYEPANRPGRNYGWPYREGKLPFRGTAPGGLTEPLLDMDRTLSRSITGGYVYRGSAVPAMRGRYVFGDYVTRRVWSVGLTIDGAGEATETSSSRVEHTTELLGGQTLGGIASFGVDAQGEIYLVDHPGGRILKFVSSAPPPRPPTNVRVIR